MRILVGLAAVFLLLAFTLPAPRKPGVYVSTRRRASLAAEYTGQSPPTELAPGEMLNLNTAGQEELERLDGVGEKLAAAILAYRKAHGAFRSVEELTQVEGFGPGRLERLRPHLTVE